METLFKFRYIIITSLKLTVNNYCSFCGLSNIRHYGNDSLYIVFSSVLYHYIVSNINELCSYTKY